MVLYSFRSKQMLGSDSEVSRKSKQMNAQNDAHTCVVLFDREWSSGSNLPRGSLHVGQFGEQSHITDLRGSE